MLQTVGETKEIDRISALPDDLLITILDLVPTKDAVATMVLSKRWFYVWTMKQRLEYKDIEEKSVWWFLENSLQLHRAPIIDSFCMELGPTCPTDAHVGKWVAYAVDRLVLDMKLNLLWSAEPTSLPKSLYSCEHLATLTLSNKILVDVPPSASLPSLTMLELYRVVYKDDDSLVRLLANCPVLERLLVIRTAEDDNVTSFRVQMPNLLYLSYNNCYRDSYGVGDTGRCLAIDTLALTFFRLYDTSGDSCSIEMPCLDTAIIDTGSYPDDKFVISLSSVVHLKLYLTPELVYISLIEDKDYQNIL
ncbi:putative FBD-associated F-box protein At1g05080 [Capsella rubella]|uniref:putative FBD-associated F-box protein At1g05080 n=1 Tax=Capsella rubella TaxID=81985 RepID=UPI000CD4EFD5|nr:putative FBD-associated F-box protein At1g05080 [Capsella rubella]